MKINRGKIDLVCERIIEYSLYCLIFFLPASKSMIELCATTAFFAWLVRRINNFSPHKAGLKGSPFFRTLLLLSLILLIPLVVVMSSTLSTQEMDLSLKTPLPFGIAAIISLTACAVLAMIMISLYGSQYIDPGLKVPVLLFIDITIITSMFTSRHINISMGAFFFKALEYLLIFFMMAEVINTRKRLINILIAISVSSFIIGLDGIYQLVGRFDFLRGFPLYAGKMTASFQFPNNFGGYLAAIIPIPLNFVIRGGVNKKVRFSLLVLSIILMACLLFTRARGAWLGFIIGVFFICLFKGKKAFFVAAALLIALALFSPYHVRNQFRSFRSLSGDVSAEDRVTIWQTGWRMFMDRPFLGHGLGTFMNVFGSYKPLNYSEIVYAHNCYLQMAAETGVAGFLIFAWLVFVLLKDAIFKSIRFKDGFLKAIFTGFAGGILAYLVHSFFDTNLYSLSLAVLFWAMAGLAAAKVHD